MSDSLSLINKSSVIAVDLLSAGLLFATVLAGGQLPRCLAQRRTFNGKFEHTAHAVQACTLVSAGAMLAATLCDMLPDALRGEYARHDTRRMLFLVGCGYLATLAVDSASHSFKKQGLASTPQDRPQNYATVPTNDLSEGISVNVLPGLAPTATQEQGNIPPAALSSVPVMFGVAMSFHSLLEGAAVGSQTTLAAALPILLPVLVHKVFAAWALGITLVEAQVSERGYWTVFAVFAVAAPAGVLLGRAATEVTTGNTAGTLTALASGTLLYIALTELIPRHLTRSSHRMQLGLCVIGGFALLSILA